MRGDLQRVRTTCRKGINQDAETANLHECEDARNVWAIDGRVEQRPGSVGIFTMLMSGTLTAVKFKGRTEDVSLSTFASPAATILDLSGLVARTTGVAGDRWYIGHTSAFDGFAIKVVTLNANTTYFKAEYYNGTAWKYLPCTELDGSTNVAKVTGHLKDDAQSVFSFVQPGDWASTTVDSQAAYWIRFTFLNADIDADCTVDVDDEPLTGTIALGRIMGLFAAQFPFTRRYISLTRNAAGAVYYGSAASIDSDNFVSSNIAAGFPGAGLSEPPTIAVVPQFEEAFVAYDNLVTRHVAYPTSSPSLPALVEDRDIYVGSGAPFDKSLIIQRSTFPEAKYILYHQGRLWAAGLTDEPATVRWSGKTPGHKVWPGVSFDYIMESDNSPIAGMFAYGEQTIVGKGDSLWLMRDRGLNELDLRVYEPEPMVWGVGLTSNSSVKMIRGRAILLAEDGIYAFDGTPNIVKLSDRVQGYIDRISPGRRPHAAAAHWRSKGCYLLSVALDGSDENDHVIVWDYVNDAWWVWDGIEAQHWLEDEGSYDDELIYFGDASGRIYELGKGRTDHGTAIDAWVQTHRLGYNSFDAKRARCVRIAGSNSMGSMSCILQPNGNEIRQTTATVDFSDSNETNKILERRFRRPRFKDVAEFFQVKLQDTGATTELQMSHLDLEYQRLGER
jgi:hypothetical protein